MQYNECFATCERLCTEYIWKAEERLIDSTSNGAGEDMGRMCTVEMKFELDPEGRKEIFQVETQEDGSLAK